MITDKQRLDWLEQNEESVYRVIETRRVPTTRTEPAYEFKDVFLGWSFGSRFDECQTIREAIDSAMNE